MNRHALALALVASIVASAAHAQATHTTTYQTTQGPLIVNWGQPAPRDPGPPPPWARMDANGDGAIDEHEAASAYPLLANDFIYADGNDDGRISQAEYTRWTASG